MWTRKTLLKCIFLHCYRRRKKKMHSHWVFLRIPWASLGFFFCLRWFPPYLQTHNSDFIFLTILILYFPFWKKWLNLFWVHVEKADLFGTSSHNSTSKDDFFFKFSDTIFWLSKLSKYNFIVKLKIRVLKNELVFLEVDADLYSLHCSLKMWTVVKILKTFKTVLYKVL